METEVTKLSLGGQHEVPVAHIVVKPEYQGDEAEVVKLITNSGAAEAPVAYLVLKNDAAGKEVSTLQRLAKKCREELPTEEIPRGYRFLKAFGTNPISTKRDSQSLKLIRENYYNVDDEGLFKIDFPEDGLAIKQYIDDNYIEDQREVTVHGI
jgi:hypothetical protein